MRHDGYNVLTGKFNHDEFIGCSEDDAPSGEHGAKCCETERDLASASRAASAAPNQPRMISPAALASRAAQPTHASSPPVRAVATLRLNLVMATSSAERHTTAAPRPTLSSPARSVTTSSTIASPPPQASALVAPNATQFPESTAPRTGPWRQRYLPNRCLDPSPLVRAAATVSLNSAVATTSAGRHTTAALRPTVSSPASSTLTSSTTASPPLQALALVAPTSTSA